MRIKDKFIFRKEKILYTSIPLIIMVDFNLIIEKGEDGYLISEVVELPGCHTQAKDMNELIKRTREAISLCLKEQNQTDIKTNFIGIQKIEV